jgi:hypothetical protein
MTKARISIPENGLASGAQHSSARKRILLVVTTSTTWRKMRGHGFITNHDLAFVLRSLGHDVEVVPTCFLESATLGFTPGEFDQVWLTDLIGVYFGLSRYHEVDPAFWGAILALAPIRVGYETETLLYGGEAGLPADEHHESHMSRFKGRLPFLTHVLANDEAVVDLVTRIDPSKRALWAPAAASRRWIPPFRDFREASEDAVFAGTIYAKREPFYEAVRGMVTKVETPDTGFGAEYDAFIEESRHTLAGMGGDPARARTKSAELTEHLLLMLESEFAALLTALRRGRIVVNLPSYTKGVVHRIPESLVAGRVVLTSRIHDRPRTMEWLEANPGVFLYDSTDELREVLSALIGQPDLVQQSARDAADYVHACGSAEVQLQKALLWIDRTSKRTESQVALTSSEWLTHGGSGR